MGCRGGELTTDDIDILENNKHICDHIKENWKLYVHMADKAPSFCTDDEGEEFQVSDIICVIEVGVKGNSIKTNLKTAIRKSELDPDRFKTIVARAIYNSPKKCSKTINKILNRCRGE